MQHFIDFSDWRKNDLLGFIEYVDSLKSEKGLFKGKTFIPETSIRTRVTFLLV